jgi:RNA polymerase sigma factor (TIGR02999 family)
MQCMTDATTLIQRLRDNDRGAVDELFKIFYGDLRRLARARLAASGRHTLLDTSFLVHEAYLRFQKVGQLEINDRQHFLAYASTALRSVVVDFVRRRAAEQRGGDVDHVTLNTELAQSLGVPDDEVIEVHDALNTLAEIDKRLVQVVEMRYFAGLTETEIAEVLGVSDRTVRRDWERARLLLAEIIKKS